MNKSIFLLSLVGLAAVACSNNAAPASEGAGATAGTELKAADFVPSKAEVDSVSYLLGVNFGSFLKGYNFGEDLNYAQIIKGMKDFVAAEGDMRSPEFAAQLKYSPQSINNAFNSFLEKRQNYLSAVNEEEGQKFLAANAKKEGVKTTPSGLQYKVLVEGKGEVPAADSRVKVNYKGTLIDGTEFDSSYKRNTPATFGVSQVIKGWTEALKMMPVGSKWQIFVPQELAYGSRETGKIKPFSTLVFEVELLEIVKDDKK